MKFERIKRLARALGWGSWRWLALEKKLARKVRRTADGALTLYDDLIADFRDVVVSPEGELLQCLRERLPQARIESVLFEHLSPLQQIALMSRTKLLVGLHGAGLTHSVFLPQESGVFEMFPGVLHAFRVNFYNIAVWRKLSYPRQIDWSRLTEPAEGDNHLPVERVADKIVAHWNSL